VSFGAPAINPRCEGLLAQVRQLEKELLRETQASRYKKFLEFDDAESYPRRVEEVRRAYQDIETPEEAAANAD
jgi:hypothetical protein